MNIELTPLETRIIGSLLEKQLTTPDQYPLSINALVLACNQKSNREPVLNLAQEEVQSAMDGLIRKHFALERSGFGSRVPKYQQRFCNTEFSQLQFTEVQRAVLCELMLRGPQTPGELRARSARMAKVTDVAEVETALEDLMTRPDGPFVLKLPREPGRRESRYAHLFCGEVEIPSAAEQNTAGFAAPSSQTIDADRLALLETEVQQLKHDLATIKTQLGI